MSEADMFALQEWERELKEVERRRLEEAQRLDHLVPPYATPPRQQPPVQKYVTKANGSSKSSDDAPTIIERKLQEFE
jgi:hypothetical protein